MSENNEKKPEMIIDFKAYKWIVSSCFQKSLRRGRFDLASSYLKFLWEHDRNYITYRFGTILAEDVGIANLPLINEYLNTKLAKKKIDEAGGLDFLMNITERACESIKDRSSCDAGYISTYYPLNIDFEGRPDSDKIAFLQSLLVENSASYIDKIHASWVLLGKKKFKHDGLPNLDSYPVNEKGETIDNLDLYMTSIKSLNIGETTPITAINAYHTQIENIFLGIPIVESLYNNELSYNLEGKLKVGDIIQNTYIKEMTIPHEPTGLNLISCGIDGHTREGKGAYYKFLKGNNSFTQYMKKMKVPYDQQMLVFSHCMFRTEGHEVNKRLYFPSAVTIMRDCEQKILDMKLGMGEKYLDFNAIKKIIIEEMPLINQLRSETIQHAEIPMIAKVEPKSKKNKL